MDVTLASLEKEQRNAVITEAMSWLRTPHHNGARVKGEGVDCGQFPIAVYSACGLMPAVDTGSYPHDFHMHRSEEWYLSIAQKYGKEIEVDRVKRGDFALYKIGRIFSHGAIVIKWPEEIIHAYTGVGVTLAHGLGGHLGDKKRVKAIKFFTLW